MNLETHNKYFRNIGYNTDPAVAWPPKYLAQLTGGADTNVDSADAATASAIVPAIAEIAYMQGHHAVNQYRVEELVKRCKHVTSVIELLTYKGKSFFHMHVYCTMHIAPLPFCTTLAQYHRNVAHLFSYLYPKTVMQVDEIICLWMDISTNCESHPVPFEPVAAFFGIWHEHRRGNHRGLHEFYWEGNYLLLLNIFDPAASSMHLSSSSSGSGGTSTYRYLMPTNVKPIRQGKQFDKSLLAEVKRRNLHIQPVKATKTGMSCDMVRIIIFLKIIL